MCILHTHTHTHTHTHISTHTHLSLSLVYQSLYSPLCSRPSRTYSQSEPSIFPCVSLLARSMGAGIKDELRSILDPMFQLGLSPGLTAALETIAKEMQLESEIQSEPMPALPSSTASSFTPPPSPSLPPLCSWCPENTLPYTYARPPQTPRGS